jgi:hypothetical protein
MSRREVETIKVAEQALNSALSGLSLAEGIVSLIRQGKSIEVDLSAAERMTASYANALMMTLLEQFPVDQVKEQVRFENVAEPVAESISAAIERFKRGLRLSTQQGPTERKLSA